MVKEDRLVQLYFNHPAFKSRHLATVYLYVYRGIECTLIKRVIHTNLLLQDDHLTSPNGDTRPNTCREVLFARCSPDHSLPCSIETPNQKRRFSSISIPIHTLSPIILILLPQAQLLTTSTTPRNPIKPPQQPLSPLIPPPPTLNNRRLHPSLPHRPHRLRPRPPKLHTPLFQRHRSRRRRAPTTLITRPNCRYAKKRMRLSLRREMSASNRCELAPDKHAVFASHYDALG